MNATSYSTSHWSAYFDQRIDVKPFAESSDSFGVYTGADSSADPSIAVVLLHGAGQTSLSWALVASILKKHVTVYAIDFRGHGTREVLSAALTILGTTQTQDVSDLSSERLCRDTEAVCKLLLTPVGQSKPPRLFLAGHSMGGAIAARISDRVGAVGLILVDIVEGTARASYHHIRALVDNRPKSFVSDSSAISWSLAARMLRSVDSACVSIPSQLMPEPAPGTGLQWRTDLIATQVHWDSWYVGLSELFLRCKAVKALLLAGVERLDKGKFQCSILPVETGHSVQEDAPKETAILLLEFVRRYSPNKV